MNRSVWTGACIAILLAAGSALGLSVPPRSDERGPNGPSVLGATTRVSVSSAGAQGVRASYDAAISAKGRYVAFRSLSRFAFEDFNGAQDIYVHDRWTRSTERMSVGSAGEQANGDCYDPAISADGRYVAFHSSASTLVLEDTNGEDDVFVHDRTSGKTERVSVDSAGIEANSGSGYASISADGRFVAFSSTASNLVADDTNGYPDVFVRDRLRGITERVSVDSAGSQGDWDSRFPSLSADGRFVAFLSDATNLVPGDTNGSADVLVRDRVRRTTELVNVDSAGVHGDGGCFDASISADGCHVAFSSHARNLVPGDTNGVLDVFVHDLRSGRTERMNVSTAGAQGQGAWGASISGDGRYVAFHSEDGSLVRGDTNYEYDVFVRDRLRGTTTRASISSSGTQGNDYSYGASISADGSCVAFYSLATDLVPGDTNRVSDILVRERSWHW